MFSGLAVLMYIDTTIEHDTTRRLKVAIESYSEDPKNVVPWFHDVLLNDILNFIEFCGNCILRLLFFYVWFFR